MKKRECLCLLFAILAVVFLTSFISAATNTTTAVNLSGFDKSYACLEDKIGTDYSSLTVEELSFSLLALAHNSNKQSKLRDALNDKKDSNKDCWPNGACTLRETALAYLALERINANVKDIQDWLLNQTMSPTELTWYLQVENPSNEQMSCTLSVDGTPRTITVRADKLITGAPGTCFTIARNGYLLQVKNTCYDKDIKISCDKDFLTSTLFNKRLEDKFYVSALTSLGAPGGDTTEKIESICFKQNNVCNYEGSLWATLALNKKDSTVREKVLPYLLALSSDNPRLLPSAFLYSLTNFDEYFAELTNEQKKEGYWQTSTDSSKRYYDTAVALMALYGQSTGQADEAIDYLLTPNVQGDGCWGNSIKSTAFILYAASPKPVSSSGGLTDRTRCENVDNHPEYSCISRATCEDDLNGTTLGNFYCIGAGDICCDKQYTAPSCSSKAGKICLASQDCSTGFVSAKESYCCLGECQEAAAPLDSLCPESNICKAECSTNEDELSYYTCADNSGKCCSPKTTASTSYAWIWLLVILIILIALAIVYRNQLKVWWFKFKNKFVKIPVAQQTRPLNQPPYGMMPRRMPPGMPMRPGMRPMPVQRPLTRLPPRPFPKDRELSETLKKLRDMSGKK